MTLRVPLAWLAVCAATVLAGGPAGAQDRDGDTIPDAVERELATDPDHPDELILVAEDGTGENADKEQYDPCHDITRVLFGNVAADRYVWCVEFLDDFCGPDSTVILYIDADNDAATGRQEGIQGCDFMLHYSGGPGGTTVYNPDGTRAGGQPPRYVADGKRLYCTFDVALKQEAGGSHHRLYVLSEQREPHVGVDSFGWLDVQGPAESERAKIMTDDDIATNVNVSVTRGYDLFERLKADGRNVHIPVSECDLEGFQMIDDEYREWSAMRRGSPARIAVKAPKGRYFPGIFVRDEGGAEKYGIYLAGERLGLGIADEDDNKTKLLFLNDALDLTGEETVEFRAARTAGGYRVESVIFLAGKPEVRERVFEVTHLEATPIRAPFVPDPTSVRLTWITSWPEACRVELAGRTIEEEQALQNHRLVVGDLEPGEQYTATVLAETPDGGFLRTEPVTFAAGDAPRRAVPRPQLMRVPLRVLNATGKRCPDWPVVCGVALPQGALMEGEPVRLVDDAGEQRDVQADPAALSPDGSVKWLHVTFFATVGADEGPALWLELGSHLGGRRNDRPLLAREEGGRISVDTGAIAFELPTDGGTALLSDLTNAQTGKRIGGRLTALLTNVEGLPHTATVDGARTVVETNGPLRCVVKVGGKFRSEQNPEAHLFDWEARVTAYRGKPFARVLFTIGNDCSDAEFSPIRSVMLRASPPEGFASATLGGDRDAPAIESTSEVSLYQDHDSHWRATDGREGSRAAGWISCRGESGPVTVAVSDFWQRYPKTLGASAEGVEVGLLPPLEADQYVEESKDPVTHVRLYYHVQDGLYKLRQGVTTTDEVYIAAGEAGDLPVEALQRPLTAVPDPEWTRATGAWGNMPVGDSFWATVFDRAMDQGFAAYLTDREETQAYGMLNFGDWWGERKYNWGNIEYDTQHAFFQHFVRTGDIRYFYAAEEAARHHGDVDMVHFHSSVGRVGGVYAHCLGHVGDYFPAGYVDGGSPGGGFTVSHTWTEGLHEAYFLTGDRRHHDNALMIADHYDGAYLNNYDWTNCRVPGWHLILTLATYRATGDPFYLNAARIITDSVMERERPGGGWRRHMVPGHCYDEPRHHGNAGFMVGVLMRGLKDMHLETGDDRLPPIIVRAARKMVEEMWAPEAEGFRYTTCPNSSPGRGMNLTSAEGFGYAVTLSGQDPELARIFERGMVLALRSIGGMGKSISHATRGTPHALRDLENLAPTGYRVGPSGEYVFWLEQKHEEAFSIQLRRIAGEGRAQATLDGGGPTVTVEPGDAATWFDMPQDRARGRHRLALAVEGDGVWTIASTCLRDVVEVAEGFHLAAGTTELYWACPAGTELEVRARPRGTGRGSITLAPPGATQGPSTAWEDAAGEWQQVTLAGQAEAGVAALTVRSQSPVVISITGAPPYLGAVREHVFVPE